MKRIASILNHKEKNQNYNENTAHICWDVFKKSIHTFWGGCGERILKHHCEDTKEFSHYQNIMKTSTKCLGL